MAPSGAFFTGPSGLFLFVENSNMDAQNAPIRRPPKTLESADFQIGQKGPVDLEGPREQIITALETPFNDEMATQLAFNEEPIEILIHPSSEKDAPLVIDCWVNGKGAEVFMNGAWHALGWLPVNKRVITRRKYVELLLKCKVDTIHTDVEDATVENPSNRINRVTSSKCLLQILHDKNPKGGEWMRSVMASNG